MKDRSSGAGRAAAYGELNPVPQRIMSSANRFCRVSSGAQLWRVEYVVGRTAMMRRILIALVAASAGVSGQQSVPAPAFEVASVKPINRDILRSRGLACGFLPSGRFEGLGDLRWFVACAYDLRAARSQQQIVGAPKWADDDLFEIRATFAPSALTVAQKLSMLQTLLADRFKLVVHRERREVPGYALVIARKDGRLGPHLQPTPKVCTDWIASGRQGDAPMIFGDLPCGRDVMSAYGMRQTRVPLSQLANLLSPRVERPVKDRTGLTDMYAFDLGWAAESSLPSAATGGLPSAATPDSLPTSIFTAVQEQLGLKLETITSTVELLVLDHVERLTPN